MLFATHQGVYSDTEMRIVAHLTECEFKTKANPHGFVNGERVFGFRRGINSNAIPHVIEDKRHYDDFNQEVRWSTHLTLKIK